VARARSSVTPLAERLALARLLLGLRAARRGVLLPLLGYGHLALQLQHALTQPADDARELVALRLGGVPRLLRHVARALRLGERRLGLRVEQLQLRQARVEARQLVLPLAHLARGEGELDVEAPRRQLGVTLGALALPREGARLAGDLVDQIVEARQVDRRLLQPPLGAAPPVAVEPHARGLLEQLAPIVGRSLSRASIMRLSITTPLSAPSPVPRTRSWMSRRRHAVRFRKYSLSPERDSRRVMTTSLNATGSVPSALSKCSETSATFTGRRADEPWKMTSVMFPPRSMRARCSPSTQRMASDTFDLPQPFGPTMAVQPSSKRRNVWSANDLKPWSSSLVSRTYRLLPVR
jgi:hypothetical protein